MKKNRASFINLCLIAVSVSVCLLVLETAVQIFMPQRVEKYVNLYIADDKLGWKLKPNSHGIFTAPEFRMEVKANKNGFRDTSHNHSKPSDIFRIVGIGDSFLFGYGVSASENVMEALNRILSKDDKFNKKIETVNLGMPGYNINQYYELLRNEAPKYSPDIVVVFFFMNDWNTTDKMDFGRVNKKGYLIGERFSLSSVRSLLYPARQFLKTNSQLYIFIRSRMLALLRKTHLMYVPEINLCKKDISFNSKYFHTFKLIKEMSEICKQKLRCPLVICMIPENFQVNKAFRRFIIRADNINPDDYDWSQPQEALRGFCLKNKIHFIDLMPILSVLELKERYYFDIDPHWNDKGHRVAAEELFGYINDNLAMTGSK